MLGLGFLFYGFLCKCYTGRGVNASFGKSNVLLFFIETKCIISLVCLCIFQPMMAIPVNDSSAFALLSKDLLDAAPKRLDTFRPDMLLVLAASCPIPLFLCCPKFAFRGKNGALCAFCHLCDRTEKKRRQKAGQQEHTIGNHSDRNWIECRNIRDHGVVLYGKDVLVTVLDGGWPRNPKRFHHLCWYNDSTDVKRRQRLSQAKKMMYAGA